jgi:hypothetical protein
LASSAFQTAGYDPVSASQMALQQIYDVVGAQSQSLGYFDVFYVFSIAAFCSAPLVFLMRRSVQEKGATPHAH